MNYFAMYYFLLMTFFKYHNFIYDLLLMNKLLFSCFLFVGKLDNDKIVDKI